MIASKVAQSLLYDREVKKKVKFLYLYSRSADQPPLRSKLAAFDGRIPIRMMQGINASIHVNDLFRNSTSFISKLPEILRSTIVWNFISKSGSGGTFSL